MRQPISTISVTTEKDQVNLGFLGVGWIGQNRMEAVLRSNNVRKAVIADPSPENITAAASIATDCNIVSTLDDLLLSDIDGIVIATPSALHAGQALAALEMRIPVFCQKPLGRNLQEVKTIVETARICDRLLGVDMSYRYCEAIRVIYDIIKSNCIGQIYAVDAFFHNAYGPDKTWFYDPLQSGGGCVIDLGTHLIDLVLWLLDFPVVKEISSCLYTSGKRFSSKHKYHSVEDYASVHMIFTNDCTLNLSCSWKLPIGKDAGIGITLYGTQGGICFKNVNGSYYDFTAELFDGTKKSLIHAPPDAWSGRAIIAWVEALKKSYQFDTSIQHVINTAEMIDLIYMSS